MNFSYYWYQGIKHIQTQLHRYKGGTGNLTLFMCLLLSLISACEGRRNYPVNTNVKLVTYKDELSEVDSSLSYTDKGLGTSRYRLFLGEILDWPEDVTADIQRIEDEAGLNYELLRYGVLFYLHDGQYEAAISLIDRWEAQKGKSAETFRWKIEALNALRRYAESADILWDFTSSNLSDPVALSFSGDTYLEFGDTVRAIYVYHLLSKNHPGYPEVVFRYAPLLLDAGYPDRALSVLANVPKDHTEGQYMLGQTLFQLGHTDSAHTVLKTFKTHRAWLTRSRWYAAEKEWDSAVAYTDRVLMDDTTVTALYQKADILDTRGWFNSASRNFSAILEVDSTYANAKERLADVERKIAYLRKIREAEKSIPTLDISSKKSINNE